MTKNQELNPYLYAGLTTILTSSNETRIAVDSLAEAVVMADNDGSEVCPTTRHTKDEYEGDPAYEHFKFDSQRVDDPKSLLYHQGHHLYMPEEELPRNTPVEFTHSCVKYVNINGEEHIRLFIGCTTQDFNIIHKLLAQAARLLIPTLFGDTIVNMTFHSADSTMDFKDATIINIKL